MSFDYSLGVLALLSVFGYVLAKKRSRTQGQKQGQKQAQAYGQRRALHSLPAYYGLYVAIWSLFPALGIVLLWVVIDGPLIHHLLLDFMGDALPKGEGQISLMMSEIYTIARDPTHAPSKDFIAIGAQMRDAAAYYQTMQATAHNALFVVVLGVSLGGLALSFARIKPSMPARNHVETVIKFLLFTCSLLAILTTFGIVLSLLFETFRFFTHVSIGEFLFGLEWSPQTALRADQVGASGAFGAVPLLAGTMLIAAIAMTVAVPIGLFSAIWLVEYAPARLSAVVKPMMEILAGIPTVVYGFFAAITVAPLIRHWGTSWGFDVSSESALAAGSVMGIMIIPFVSSLSGDVINAVPQTLRDGSYALGATRSETIRKIVLPAALPGIVGSLLLAVSRAIGETMIVVMAAGLAANLTANPFQAVTTVTTQIVVLLIGDQEFDSAKTLAAFALGLLLFCITLVLNIIALHVVNKYREIYD